MWPKCLVVSLLQWRRNHIFIWSLLARGEAGGGCRPYSLIGVQHTHDFVVRYLRQPIAHKVPSNGEELVVARIGT